MRDAEIRHALHGLLRAEHANEPDTRFLDELDLCGLVRVDVAVVNGTLSGYELKSDYDTLRRLPEQVRVYSTILDRAALVVGERQYAHLAATMPGLIPDWWGVLVATDVDGQVVLQPAQAGGWNDDVDPYSVAQLLWREEALDELEVRGLDRGVRSKPRHHLWRRLADELPSDELRATVRRRLKTREGWRSPPPGA